MVFRTVTRLSDFNLLDTAKTNQKDIQNIFKRLFSPGNVFFVSQQAKYEDLGVLNALMTVTNHLCIFKCYSSVCYWKRKGCRLIFFDSENVNSENYRNLLINYAFPRVASLNRDYRFQKDGAPSHSSNRVRNY